MEMDGWTQIAQFTGFTSDFDASVLLSRLESEGIPASRFPLQAPSTILAGITDQPIYVLVPHEHKDAAEALLASDEQDNDEADE